MIGYISGGNKSMSEKRAPYFSNERCWIVFRILHSISFFGMINIFKYLIKSKLSRQTTCFLKLETKKLTKEKQLNKQKP